MIDHIYCHTSEAVTAAFFAGGIFFSTVMILSIGIAKKVWSIYRQNNSDLTPTFKAKN